MRKLCNFCIIEAAFAPPMAKSDKYKEDDASQAQREKKEKEHFGAQVPSASGALLRYFSKNFRASSTVDTILIGGKEVSTCLP